jgi:HNH endonuclease
MSILTKASVLVLNHNWQAINVRTPQEAFCMMATNLDHVVPCSRGGKDAWENPVWSAKEVNQRKADRLPHEAGLKVISVPRAPKELPLSTLIRNMCEIEDWKLFLT